MLQSLATALLLGLVVTACAGDEPVCGAVCATQLLQGEEAGGELGFRFSRPVDMNGDGVADVAAGARFADLTAGADCGVVYAFSGATRNRLLAWEGSDPLALFGHVALAVPDLNGDRLADLVASAPNGGRGRVSARSPTTGVVLWETYGDLGLGWHLTPAGDHDGDGVDDIVAGAPVAGRARVELLSGATGEVLRTYEGPSDTFGFYAAALADLDGDERADFLVGAPLHSTDTPDIGAAFLISSGSGQVLHSFIGEEVGSRFGEMLSGIEDIDGDGLDDVAIGAPYTNTPGQVGQVYVFSSATGALLHRLVGSQPGAIYGRMVARVYDVDEDGTDDLAIGAPWRRVDGIDRAGYFEIRSGRTMEVIASVAGSRENAWLGWHIAPAERMIDGTHRGILVSSILSEENGVPGAGRIELYELHTP